MLMADTKYKHKARDMRGVSGGVALRLALCAVSLAVLGGAIIALMGTFKERKAEDYRRALSKCDIGLQEAFVRLNGPAEPNDEFDLGLFKGEPDEDGANFVVEYRRENRGDTSLLKIVSTGTSGTVTQVRECTLRRGVSEEGDSLWVNEGIR
jgi:hypothetical protein